MRIVILTNAQGNQVALANKIANVADVAGIVLSGNVPRRAPTAAKKATMLFNRIAGRTVGRRLVDAWSRMLAKYDELHPSWPSAEITRVQNINDPETIEAIGRLDPDLVVVSGTNIVGKAVIEAGPRMVNLHTGISPYVRGGPNCTNWCLEKKWFHLIGNTVMWIDAGIDTGNIIATERTPLSGDESLFDLHWAVMEHAHDLYRRAITAIGSGATVPSVPQSSIAVGSHFANSDWGARQMLAAVQNFDRDYRTYFRERVNADELDLRLFPLNNA